MMKRKEPFISINTDINIMETVVHMTIQTKFSFTIYPPQPSWPFRIEALVYFSETQWRRARDRFQKILIYLDYTFPKSQEEEAKASHLKRTALMNMAICSMRMEEYREAISYTNQVIRDSPDYAKAYFCRGKSRRLLCEFDEARKDLKECIRLAPNNAEVRREAKILDSDERCYALDQAELAKEMFSKRTESTEKDTPKT